MGWALIGLLLLGYGGEVSFLERLGGSQGSKRERCLLVGLDDGTLLQIPSSEHIGNAIEGSGVLIGASAPLQLVSGVQRSLLSDSE